MEEYLVFYSLLIDQKINCMVTIPKQKDLFLGVNLRVSVCETLLNNSTLSIDF